jgi:hypothetical protein
MAKQSRSPRHSDECGSEPEAADLRSRLSGTFDLHVHAAPDVVPRKLDDLELVKAAADAGMHGFLLKSHHGSTVERAYLLNRVEPRTLVAGGVTLNEAVGGLNPAAVETAITLGARCIWMPTQSAANHKRHKKKAGIGLSVITEEGRLGREVNEILELIAAADVLLATGHLDTAEVQVLAPAARKAGVKRILISHVELDEISMPLGVQLELARLGCYIEHSLIAVYPVGGNVPFAMIADNIRRVGPDACVITTDFGQPEQPDPPAGLALFIEKLVDHGFGADAIETMATTNPRQLVS